MTEEDYRKRTDHFRHCPGAPEAPDWGQAHMEAARALADVSRVLPWHWRTNAAWAICLYKGGAIDPDTARKVLAAVDKVRAESKPTGGRERSMIDALDGDEDMGSVINYGRTLQEPMSRLQMRARLIEVFDTIHNLMMTVLNVAEANVDTVMVGHTHFSHAQPITFAHYLLSVFDALRRGEEQLRLAYKHVNRNSGGCGSTSGTVWHVDRRLMTRLLGFDDLVEPTYDCEASQDHSMSVMFALSNIALLISKVSMDLEIWTTEEFALFDVEPGYLGQSSMMPQKAHPGSRLERTRVPAAEVLGETVKGMLLTKGEPHGDVIPMISIPLGPLPKAMAQAEVAMKHLRGFLAHIRPRKGRMLQIAREGFSCSTEIVVHMVREKGYGGRRAHRITATFVRMARERGIKADEVTGELLDEAAVFLGERAPGIDTTALRRLLDPTEFIQAHSNIGGTARVEAGRMLSERREAVAELARLQEKRRRRIQEGDDLLRREMDAILRSP